MGYSFCENQHATGRGKWHIRKLSDEGLKLGGGADTLSLCEYKVAWDLEVEITEHHLDKNTCERCKDRYLEETS